MSTFTSQCNFILAIHCDFHKERQEIIILIMSTNNHALLPALTMKNAYRVYRLDNNNYVQL